VTLILSLLSCSGSKCFKTVAPYRDKTGEQGVTIDEAIAASPRLQAHLHMADRYLVRKRFVYFYVCLFVSLSYININLYIIDEAIAASARLQAHLHMADRYLVSELFALYLCILLIYAYSYPYMNIYILSTKPSPRRVNPHICIWPTDTW